VGGLDLQGLVSYVEVPADLRQRWEVAGGAARWRGRTGLQIGVLEIRNARCHAIVLDFGAGDVSAFHPIDLFPARKAGA